MRTHAKTMALRRLEPDGVVDCRRGIQRVFRVSMGRKWWKVTDWTGTKSQFLKVPYDGTTPPSYLTATEFEDSLTNGMPDDAIYVDLYANDAQFPRV